MRKLLFFLLLSYALALPAHAQESTLQILDTTELEQALPDAAEEIYGNLPVDASAWNDAAGKLLRWIGENALPVFRHALDSATTIMTILLLCAAAESVAAGVGQVLRPQEGVAEGQPRRDAVVPQQVQHLLRIAVPRADASPAPEAVRRCAVD